MTTTGATHPTTPSQGHNVLLLSCMDLRLLDEIVAHMEDRNLTDRYDHVILAGASLGVMHPSVPHWSATFWDHLDLAIELHKIEEVRILEHRECGAYKKFLGLDFADDPGGETAKHAEVAHSLRDEILKRRPTLRVKCYLMDLGGHVASI